MTYIRLTGGRDRGQVKDMPFPDAQEMLALGQALPVDFDEPDPLGFRELETPVTTVRTVETLSTASALTSPVRMPANVKATEAAPRRKNR